MIADGTGANPGRSGFVQPMAASRFRGAAQGAEGKMTALAGIADGPFGNSFRAALKPRKICNTASLANIDTLLSINCRIHRVLACRRGRRIWKVHEDVRGNVRLYRDCPPCPLNHARV